MICKKYGAQLPDNSQFCGHCGASFNEPTSSMKNSVDLNYPQQPVYNNGAMKPVKKKNKVLLTIAIIVIGNIIYGIIHALFYDKTSSRLPSGNNSSYSYSSSYSSHSKDSNDKNSIQQTKFSVDYVKGSYLDGYENKTIGTAFDDAFNDTDWSYSKECNIQYVKFAGVYSGLGIYLNFYYDPSIHNEDEFELDFNDMIMMDLDTEEYRLLDETLT